MTFLVDRGGRVAVAHARGQFREAKRLVGLLDGYRPPQALEDVQTAFGFAPLELEATLLSAPSSGAEMDLPPETRLVLRDADHLVVVCGEGVAEDRWVDDEIRTFLAHRRAEGAEGRLHLVMTPGDPTKATPLAAAEAEATPVANLSLNENGWRNSVTRIRAALLGVPPERLDLLEAQRASARLRAAALMGAGLAVIGLAALSVLAG